MKHPLCVVALLAACGGIAQAQPAIVMSGVGGGDLSSDGMKTVGFVYDDSVGEVRIFRYVRGVGASDTGAIVDSGAIRSSADCTAMSFETYNQENLGGFGTNKLMTHRWDAVNGTVNCGLQPQSSSCDVINYSSDISRDGRYVVGSGWTQTPCGWFRAFVYDAVAHTIINLPASVSAPPINAIALNTRADAVNGDGTVVVGYDENYNASFSATVRRAAVWDKSSGSWIETILDTRGGTANGVNATGNVLVGNMNAQTMQATFGTSVTTPIKWTKAGSTWVPTNLGGTADMAPVFVSNDGNTVVGTGGSGAIWIWRPSINGGVPMDLGGYLASQNALPPNLSVGTVLGPPLHALTEDGNTIKVSFLDSRNSCLTSGNTGMIYLNGTTCEPARVGFSPVSQSVQSTYLYAVILNVFASGSWPLNYQWQKESSPGVWTNLVDDNCGVTNELQYDVRGPSTPQLRLGRLSQTWEGNYRCVITNPCGSVTSAVAAVHAAPPPCYANCDESTAAPVLNANDFQCFLNQYAAGSTSANCDNSTAAPILNANDFQCFLNQFAAGCP